VSMYVQVRCGFRVRSLDIGFEVEGNGFRMLGLD